MVDNPDTSAVTGVRRSPMTRCLRTPAIRADTCSRPAARYPHLVLKQTGQRRLSTRLKETLFERHRQVEGFSRGRRAGKGPGHSTILAMLDRTASLGLTTIAALAVVADVFTDRAFREMHDAKVLDVRFNFAPAPGHDENPAAFTARSSDRIRPFGWHVVVYLDAEDLEELIAVPLRDRGTRRHGSPGTRAGRAWKRVEAIPDPAQASASGTRGSGSRSCLRNGLNGILHVAEHHTKRGRTGCCGAPTGLIRT